MLESILLVRSAIKRLIEPAEVAELVAYLCSPAAAFITGASLTRRRVDGSAATSIHVASAPDLDQVTGRYFANSKPRRSGQRSYDKAAAARLWQVSADLVGLTG